MPSFRSFLNFTVGATCLSLLVAGNDVVNTRVAVLGGGLAGIIAARTLHDRGLDDFVILEGRNELGTVLFPWI
ncbi:MAG TPA: NAD(P)-binding protein [Chlamydiales bacterium]|nr:NAD(P)-binding protein [Chlamydiales bacterium]